MDAYPLVLSLVGVAILAVAWLPTLLKKIPLSYPMLFVAFGVLIYQLPLGLPSPLPLESPQITTHLTELCVIVALTGTGLKIDRPFSWRNWRIPLRFTTIAMILCIALLALVDHYVAGWPLASAVLLAAALAPTDPVLAGDVQVEGPGEGGEDVVRFSLTSEAGLNDGLAFPFVWLALFLVGGVPDAVSNWGEWLLYDVVYRVGVGIGAGYLSGKLLAYLILGLPQRLRISPDAYGFLALSITLISYGLTELVHGYGFLAVFVAAVAIRGYERTHKYHREMHDFSDQIERILVAVLLILFGGAIARGLLAPLTWTDVLVALFLLLLIRPAVGWLTLLGTQTSLLQRGAIAVLGIRGIGSFFYLSFAIEKGDFSQPERLWALVGLIVLVSIVFFGVLARPLMNWIDRRERVLARRRHEGRRG
jgi:NhaP-type Na+/H+ or K+/H+ antiporter